MPPSGPEGTIIMDSSPAAVGNAGRSGDYPAAMGNAGRSGDYPAAAGNAGRSGGFPTAAATIRRSGDFPALIEPGPMTAPMGGAPFGRGSHPQIGPTTPQAFAADPRLSHPELAAPGDLMFVAGPARPADRKRGGPRAFVFVGVALLSMIIVVVTGLLIFAATD
jgi:hypothetical protein